MIDVRDSYFQSNPFNIITSNPAQKSQFHVFKGVDMPIGQCGWNGPWVSDCFGNEVLNHFTSCYYFIYYLNMLLDVKIYWS